MHLFRGAIRNELLFVVERGILRRPSVLDNRCVCMHCNRHLYHVFYYCTTIYYETKEDEIQGHINFFIIMAASLAVRIGTGLLMSVFLYFIDKLIVWLHEGAGKE